MTAPGASAVLRSALRVAPILPRDLLFLALGTIGGAWVLVVLALLVGTQTTSIIGGLLVLAVSARLLLPGERLRLRLVGLRVPGPPARPRTSPGARALWVVVGDLDGRHARYLLLLAPVGLACGSLALALWTTGVLGLLDGHWGRATSYLPVDRIDPGPPNAGTRLVAGLVVLPLAVAATRLLALAQTRLAAATLIGPGPARLHEVLASRARVVEAQTAELQRIERDLHDGAQARIVALHMQLGLLGRALGPEPGPARDRLVAAQDTARAALADLRHLVRGMHPPILTDRGLAAALAALAADLTVPVELDVVPEDRFAPVVEAAAYFTVAEALANVAKHAGATRARVHVSRDRHALHVTVRDDGHGGADPAGPGLVGLRHRLEALDGRLTVDSPPGGPTTLRAELPCG